MILTFAQGDKMLFCEKCGSILMPKKEGKKKVMACKKCGFKSKDFEKATLSERSNSQKKKVEVIEKEFEAHPLVDQECPKCKHKKAYFWTSQTRASDEPETKFFKCEKCKHTWRDYS